MRVVHYNLQTDKNLGEHGKSLLFMLQSGEITVPCRGPVCVAAAVLMTVSLWHPASPDSSHTPMSVCLTSALPFSFLCWLPCHCFAAVLLGAATQHAIIYVNDTNIIGGCYCGGCPGLVLLPRYPLTSLIVSAKFFE